MSKRSITHATFTIERTLSASPARAFAAFADPALKARWFSGPTDKFSEVKREQDFRPGGQEVLKGSWKDGPATTFLALYLEIVPEVRIIYVYDMYLDDIKISVSLASIEFEKVEGGTRLTITEQGAFLDGYADAGSREKGTGALLDAFEKTLSKI